MNVIVLCATVINYGKMNSYNVSIREVQNRVDVQCCFRTALTGKEIQKLSKLILSSYLYERQGSY